MSKFEFFSLMGGVGLFLYGMSIMSSGLKNASGDKMRVIPAASGTECTFGYGCSIAEFT